MPERTRCSSGGRRSVLYPLHSLRSGRLFSGQRTRDTFARRHWTASPRGRQPAATRLHCRLPDRQPPVTPDSGYPVVSRNSSVPQSALTAVSPTPDKRPLAHGTRLSNRRQGAREDRRMPPEPVLWVDSDVRYAPLIGAVRSARRHGARRRRPKVPYGRMSGSYRQACGAVTGVSLPFDTRR